MAGRFEDIRIPWDDGAIAMVILHHHLQNPSAYQIEALMTRTTKFWSCEARSAVEQVIVSVSFE